MATPAVPRRQGRPKLSLMMTPRRTPNRAASAARMASAEPSGSSGSSNARSMPSERRDVGLVHTGVGHHEAQPMLHDQQVGAGPDDAGGFRQDHLDQARVLADLRRPVRWRGQRA